MNDLIQRIGHAYDELPYQSAAFAQSAPEHLQAVAHLFGLRAPSPERARVLELGCAAGGNLLPFAARWPNSRSIGVDLSAVQVQAGRELVAELRLGNLDLRQLSITDIGEGFGKFDYIVCHGVYSWVPAQVQEAILRVCANHLADDGVAYVSYNTYPGWKVKEIVRDAMILRGGGRESAQEKLGYARGMIEFMHETARPGSVLKQTLDEHIELIRTGQSHYLTHEFLELCNAPCYFHQFMQRAKASGLNYLAESAIASMFVGNYGARAAAALLRECGDQESLEQMLDFLDNRTFRQTLLVRAGRRASYRLTRPRLLDLHIAGAFAIDGGSGPDEGAQTYRALHNQHRFRVATPATREVLRRLNEAAPATLPVRELLKHTAGGSAEVAGAVLNLVEFLLINGAVRFRLAPLTCGRADQLEPCVDAAVRRLAQRQAGARSPLPVTLFNRWHDALPEPGPVDLAVLPLLDGLTSRATLIGEVRARNAAGQIHFLREGAEIVEPDARAAAAVEHVDAALLRFERMALLAPAD